MNSKMEVGKTYVFFVPPAWILAGTVQEVTEKEIVLVDAIYQENCSQGFSAWDLANTLEASQQSWPLPDGSVIQREGVLIYSPATIDFKTLAKRRELEAIRGSK